MDDKTITLKKSIIAIGRLLWEKDLASGLNGNISVRFDDASILLTGHATCLGLLEESGILHLGLDGTLLEDGKVSTEKLLHTEIYKNLPEVQAVVHSHTTFTNAFFLENDTLNPAIFESKLYLGNVEAIQQFTPAVTDAKPVIDGLRKNNIVVLKNHGVVAVGKNLFDCFLLIQALEDAVTVDAVRRLYSSDVIPAKAGISAKLNSLDPRRKIAGMTDGESKKYKLFSREQIDAIVEIVNADAQLKELGQKTNMTMDLAVCLNETGQTYSFSFKQGRIENVGTDPNVEFLITAPETVWRAVFNREIDPFVATTQKKMNLRGDFAKISKWYAPCSRLFELWNKVPVE